MNDKSEYFDLMSDRNKIFVVLLSVELGLFLITVGDKGRIIIVSEIGIRVSLN